MKRSLSLLLIVTLSLPSLFGLHHYLSEDHNFCYEQEIHFHQDEIECSTCDFVRLNFDYDNNSFDYLENQFIPDQKLITVNKKVFFSRFKNPFGSRAPPSNC